MKLRNLPIIILAALAIYVGAYAVVRSCDLLVMHDGYKGRFGVQCDQTGLLPNLPGYYADIMFRPLAITEDSMRGKH